jgi:hypothetical protein
MVVAVAVGVTPLPEQMGALEVADIVVAMEAQPPRGLVPGIRVEPLQHMEMLVQILATLAGAQALVVVVVVHRVQDLGQPAEREFLFQLRALPKFMVLEVAVMLAPGVAEEQTQETVPAEQVLQATGAASMLLTTLAAAAGGPLVETALPAQGARVS